MKNYPTSNADQKKYAWPLVNNKETKGEALEIIAQLADDEKINNQVEKFLQDMVEVKFNPYGK